MFGVNIFVVFLLAILVIASKVDSHDMYSIATQGGRTRGKDTDLRPDKQNDGLTLGQYPAVLNDRSDYKTTLATGIISMILALGLGCFCTVVRKRAKALLVSQSAYFLSKYQASSELKVDRN